MCRWGLQRGGLAGEWRDIPQGHCDDCETGSKRLEGDPRSLVEPLAEVQNAPETPTRSPVALSSLLSPLPCSRGPSVKGRRVLMKSLLKPSLDPGHEGTWSKEAAAWVPRSPWRWSPAAFACNRSHAA